MFNQIFNQWNYGASTLPPEHSARRFFTTKPVGKARGSGFCR